MDNHQSTNGAENEETDAASDVSMDASGENDGNNFGEQRAMLVAELGVGSFHHSMADPRDAIDVRAPVDNSATAAMTEYVQHGSRLPRTMQTRPRYAPPGLPSESPRSAATSSSGPRHPRTAMTVRVTLEAWDRANTVPSWGGVGPSRLLVDLPTFDVNSDPAISGTRTTLAKRKERLAEDCVITLMPIIRPCETVCGHIFEAEHLAQAWLIRKNCPVCRAPLPWLPPMVAPEMHFLGVHAERKVEADVGTGTLRGRDEERISPESNGCDDDDSKVVCTMQAHYSDGKSTDKPPA